MTRVRLSAVCLAIALSCVCLGVTPVRAAEYPKGQKGKLTGVVTAKGPKWIELRGEDGMIKHYIVPGGLPEDKKTYDAKVIAEIQKTRVNSRVELNWEFQKYLRVTGIRLLERS